MRKILAGILFLLAGTSVSAQIVINEIQVANIDMYIDPSFDYGGWIELYNSGSSSVSLSQAYISEDPDNLKEFQFGSAIGSIPANGYKVIWFDHNNADGNYSTKSTQQVRFKLNMDGGTLYLSDSSGKKITELTYPAGMSRCSYARKTDGGNEWEYTAEPTPGKTNTTSTFSSKRIDAPVVDTNSQMFTGTLTFNVDIPNGCTLRYTTDGSCPTKTNGWTRTGGAFTIKNTGIFRFRLYRDGYLPSEVVTRSFILRDKDYTFPVVSVVTANDNLYGDSIGVYTVGVNGISGRGINYNSNINMDWERPVNFEFITPDNKMAVNQEADFYISGGWSRHWAPSSFKIKAEKIYDEKNSIDYRFFNEKPYIKNKVLLFRNGGNDTYGRMKDACIAETFARSGFYLDCQAWQPVHVFFNGSFLATLNMREPNNKFFAYSNYGIDTDNVDALELSGGIYCKAGDKDAFNDLTMDAVYAQYNGYMDKICALLDIDEYINYMAAETSLGSSDWLTNNNNLKLFRSRDNGKFHFVMFDVDGAFDVTNMLVQVKQNSNGNAFSLFFNRLMKNETWKRQFINTYCIVDGSILTNERVTSIANEMANTLSTALSWESKSPWSTANDVINRGSSSTYRNYRMSALQSYFSLSNPTKVQINSNISEARMTMDGVEIPTGTFDGTIYPPVTLSATAPAGYNFVGWQKGVASTEQIFSQGSKWHYYDNGSLDGQEWKDGKNEYFEENTAPLGYSKNNLKTTISYGGDSNNKYPTYYFTKAFTLDNKPDNNDKMTLTYVVDDGFIVYINGEEAGRYNMPSGNVNFSTYATTYCSGNPDSGSITLPTSLFRKGDNVIAVEVHNNSGTSTDIYWDAALSRSYNKAKETFADRDLTLTTTDGGVFTAVFEPIEDEHLALAGSTPVVINEVSAGNDIYVNDYFKRTDWIELYNTTSSDIDIAGMYLSDNADDPEKYQISADDSEAGTIIPAHGYLVIWADKLSPIAQLHSSFKLGNADNECVILTAADKTWSNTLEYMAHESCETVGRYPDAGKRVYRMTRPTIGAQNELTSYSTWLSGEDKNFNYDEYMASITGTATTGATSTEYYSIDGMRLSAPQKGIIIVKETKNGQTTVTKKFIK